MNLRIIGIGDLIRHLPTSSARIRETADAVVAARPDVLVIIDSPDFTHRVARLVRRAAPAIPIVDYVSPSVWAWRPWRARAMRAYVDYVLAILPFEPAALAKLRRPALHLCRPSAGRAARRAASERRGGAAPALRSAACSGPAGQPRRRDPPAGRSLARALALSRQRHGAFELVLPTVPHLAARVREAIAGWPVAPRDRRRACGEVGRVPLPARGARQSGTVTLELALAGVPMVTAYRVMPLEADHAAVALLNTVILANLVSGERIVPEFLQQDCTPERLADASSPLLADTPERRRQIEGFARSMPSWKSAAPRRVERAAGIVTRSRRRPASGARQRIRAPNNLPRPRVSTAPIGAAITGVHGYVPPDVLTNAELAQMVDTSDEWIVERTGIKERHILKGEGLGTSHMGAEAVRGLLEKTGTARRGRPPDLRHDDAGLRISLDRQSRLRHGGIHNIGSFDVQATCSGFVYALTVASQFIEHRQIPQDRAGRRRQDVGDHRLYRPCDLRAVRRRRRSGAD